MRKKQWMRSLMLLCAVMFGILALTSGKVQAADSDFVIKKGVLKEYKGSSKKVEIPEGVKKIGRQAFYSQEITSVTIPSTVKSIDEQAFMFTNIKKITIPENVKKIGIGAFFGCSNLKEMTILNAKLKFESSSWGENLFDGMSSGYIRDKITIKGYKNSTAEQLVEELNGRNIYADPCPRFKKAVFKELEK